MIEWTSWHEFHTNKIEIIQGIDCWIWTAGVNKRGYGRVSYLRRGEYAHRAAYMEANGVSGAGLIRHSCGCPSCVRPGHLKPGTQADNAKDMATMFTGPGHLVAQDVRDIRTLYRDGSSLRSIAAKFDIAPGTVYPIVIGKSYRHVDPDEKRMRALRSPQKLTEDDVSEIRRRLASGEKPQSKIAKDYGVRQSMISRIKTGLRRA